MVDVPKTLFTIGHSTLGIKRFVELVQACGITAIADVRSSPNSRANQHFGQASLQKALSDAGILYVYLGAELGARPKGRGIVTAGQVSFHRVAARPAFQQGIQRVLDGARRYQLALMCEESDPIECHRMILVCRRLRGLVGSITHVLADGTTEPNLDAERRLCRKLGLSPSLFSDEASVIESAYEMQSREIAFETSDT